MKISSEYGTWKCFVCEHNTFRVTKVTEYWIDVKCLKCGQEDAILVTTFNSMLKDETENDR